VYEAQPGRQERQDGRRAMRGGREGRGGARLVMILEEAHRPPLKLGLRAQVGDDRVGVRPRPELVVELLVVGVVEALPLQGRLEAPVHFGHEDEVRPETPDLIDRPRPERLVDRGASVCRP